MFNLVTDTMRSNKATYFAAELEPLFTEFLDLKYVIDPVHEQRVLAQLLYNLLAISACQHGPYVNTVWRKRYNCEVFNVEPVAGVTSREYAEQVSAILVHAVSSQYFELIRLVICYGKSKGYIMQNYFAEFCKKLEFDSAN